MAARKYVFDDQLNYFIPLINCNQQTEIRNDHQIANKCIFEHHACSTKEEETLQSMQLIATKCLPNLAFYSFVLSGNNVQLQFRIVWQIVP